MTQQAKHPTADITYRPATPFDAPRIAELHARSWQRHYRGDLPDTFLDNRVREDRLRVWADRFSRPNDKLEVMLAEDGDRLVGFCCLLLDDHPEDGALLDNLHVTDTYQGQGIGRRLMRWAAVTTLAHDPGGRFYLWVLSSNTAAAAFYAGLGGRPGRRERKHLTADGSGGVEAISVHFRAEDLVH